MTIAADSARLRAAIDEGNQTLVGELLSALPQLSSIELEDGSTPLHLAAETNQPEIVELLVQHGARLDASYGTSAHTPLSWALTVEALDAARKLVTLGSEPDLFCAAGLGDLARVKAFWTNGRLRSSPSKTGSSRTTETGEELPRPPKADADHVSDALYIASRLGQVDVARWLVDHGADPNWRGYSGATPLAWAEFSGSAELCAVLRASGASDDVRDYVFQATPRAFPVFVFSNWGFPRRLLERLSADHSLVEARSVIGTPLHAAVVGNQMVCARVLLSFGADKAAVDANGRTPADLAVATNRAEIAAML